MTSTTKGLLIGAAVVAAGAITVTMILHFTAPKDTPIVAGGGSIYGQTSPKDSDGWTFVSNVSEYASLHPGSVQNPHGIDELTFANFDTTPTQNPETNTGGWAILIRNPLPPPSTAPNPIPAVSFCSDATCTAALPGCNPNSFNKKGVVYFSVRAGAQLDQIPNSGPGKAIGRIEFHDTDPACNQTTPSPCDNIYDVTLKTCNGGINPVFTTTCKNNPKTCGIQVGH